MGFYQKGAVLALFSALVSLSSGAKIHLHMNDNYMLEYEVSGDGIDFQIQANGVGWVGLGINNKTGGMVGADLFMGGYDNIEKKMYGYDVFGNGTQNGRPTNDTAQDGWNVLSASEGNGKTTVRVQRKLNATDLAQDMSIENKTMFLLWSYNKDSDITTSYHTERGSCTFNLIAGSGGDCHVMADGGNGASVANIGLGTLLMAMVAAVLKN